MAKRYLATEKTQGAQNLVVDGISLPLNFDGWKCYFNVSKPTTEELKILPRFVLTSELPYLPQRSVVACNVDAIHSMCIVRGSDQYGPRSTAG